MKLFILLYAVNFFRTLLVILIIYFALRILRRYVLPFLIERGLRKMQQNMYKQSGQQATRPEGEVKVEGQPRQKGTTNTDDEEYVDFEEIK